MNVSFRNLFRSVSMWFVYFDVIHLYRPKHYVPVSTIYLCFLPFSVFNLVTNFVSFVALIPLIWSNLLCFAHSSFFLWSDLLVFRSSSDYLKLSFKVSVLPLIIWFLWFLLLFTNFFFSALYYSAIPNVCAIFILIEFCYSQRLCSLLTYW